MPDRVRSAGHRGFLRKSGALMSEELLSNRVPRSLESKTKLFGFEIADLLLIFINLSVLNLVFGGSKLRYPLVWGSTVFLLAMIYFVKRGRPDSFIQHAIEHYTRRPVLYANLPDEKAKPFLLKREDSYV
jgi:hypothetical protein